MPLFGMSFCRILYRPLGAVQTALDFAHREHVHFGSVQAWCRVLDWYFGANRSDRLLSEAEIGAIR